jgi:hypothetical protein
MPRGRHHLSAVRPLDRLDVEDDRARIVPDVDGG